MAQLREEQQFLHFLRSRGLRSTAERRALIREIFAQHGMQELLAQSLRTKEPVSGLAVESFMRQYYRHTTRIRYFAEEIIQKVTDPSLASGPQGLT